MPDASVDDLIQRYCDCARTTWNSYLRSRDPDEAALARFDEVRALLFRAIVLDPLGMGDETRDDGESTWPFLRVTVTEAPTILVNKPSDDGNQYWERAEKGTDLSDAELEFVDLFDWDPAAFRDLALVLALVIASPKHPELVGRSVLLERSGVSVVFEPPREI